MRCYVILSNVIWLMCIKMWLHYPLLQSLDRYKVRLCFIVLSVTVCTVGYICLFCGDRIFVNFVGFLSMIIYKPSSPWCLKYNVCSAWFLDIRISTCYNYHHCKWQLRYSSTTTSYYHVLLQVSMHGHTERTALYQGMVLHGLRPLPP